MEERQSVPPGDFLSEIKDRKRQLDEGYLLALNSVPKEQTAERQRDTRDVRADEFLRRIKKPRVVIPDPVGDFHMYEKMDEAMNGLHEHLDRLRRNYGTVGYSSQNLMSDLSKAYINEAQMGDANSEEEMTWSDFR